MGAGTRPLSARARAYDLFDGTVRVTIEDGRRLGAGGELRVRLTIGDLNEAALSREDLLPPLEAEPKES